MNCTAVQSMTASAYVFCAELQAATASGTRTSATDFLLAQELRPTTADWPPMQDSGTYIYVDAVVSYALLQPCLHTSRCCCVQHLRAVANLSRHLCSWCSVLPGFELLTLRSHLR